jgi:carbon-monoxide dehydrogenase medium subunit
MKPASFKYYAPNTVDEILTHLAEHGYDAKPLAGGQSLIPTMNFRLAQPAILVDLNNVPDLFYIRPDENGGLCLGAMARHVQVERSSLVAERAPLIHETMPKIATSQIRSRGTFGGSIAHADPSAELPAVSLALNARFRLQSQAGARWVSANEFFVGMFTTLLEPEELLVEIEIPAMPPRTGWAIEEIARRPHDFALVGVVAVVTLDKENRCSGAKIALLSVGDGPVLAQRAAETLQSQVSNPALIRAAAETAATADIDPGSDIHASAAYRRHLAKVMTERALQRAFERAKVEG